MTIPSPGCPSAATSGRSPRLTADLHAALASEALRPYRRVQVLGYSLGGHLALRLGTEPGDPRLAAVAAICSPLDLALSQREIDAPPLWIYRRYLLRSLNGIYAEVASRRPPGSVPIPVAEAARIRTLREWDGRVVAPRHGFTGADDYYARASVAPRLPDLRVPALLVHSEWDPMVPARAVRAALKAVHAPRLEVRWIAGGGHVAFPRGTDAGLGEGSGVDAQVVGWLQRPSSPRPSSPDPSLPSLTGRRGRRLEDLVGCAARTLNGLEGAHSAPYERTMTSLVLVFLPSSPGEGGQGGDGRRGAGGDEGKKDAPRRSTGSVVTRRPVPGTSRGTPGPP